MKRVVLRLLTLIPLISTLPCTAQHPSMLDVATVVVGAQRLETLYAHAAGKWSDAGDGVGQNSTEIHCYQRFGFCEVGSASALFKESWVTLTNYDILRWDANEMIAVDSSALCVVNTVRFDFVAKKVSISSASKGETRSKACASLSPSDLATAFLIGATGEPEQKKK
jgi:hypothetical protein